MPMATLSQTTNLSIVSAAHDPELQRIRDTIEHPAIVGNRVELEVLLGRLLAAKPSNPRPRTLDLIGHATSGGMLALGSFVIDASNAVVASFFRELADHDVLPRLGIHGVRLLGSLTAGTAAGLATLCALSDVLGVEVFGTRNLMFGSHFDRDGFVAERGYLLSRASDVRRDPPSRQPLLAGDPSARVLDVDSLPVMSAGLLGDPTSSRRWATRDEAHALLGLVSRNSGRTMPGLLAQPCFEVTLPAATDGAYHIVQVLLEGSFVRVDHGAVGTVCYPVTAPRELLELIQNLPTRANAVGS